MQPSTMNTKPLVELQPEPKQLNDDQIALIQEAISSGCSDSEAAAVAGVPVRDWNAYAARRVMAEPDYLNDLKALSEQIEGWSKIGIVRKLKRADDERFALDVAGRRIDKWSSKATVNVTMPTPILDVAAVRAGAIEGEKVVKELVEGDKVDS